MDNSWYTVDTPRDRPCWEVNPRLWEHFSRLMADRGATVTRNPIYTEQCVVQAIDLSLSGSNRVEVQGWP